jgi:hypothetical protein
MKKGKVVIQKNCSTEKTANFITVMMIYDRKNKKQKRLAKMLPP